MELNRIPQTLVDALPSLRDAARSLPPGCEIVVRKWGAACTADDSLVVRRGPDGGGRLYVVGDGGMAPYKSREREGGS